MPLVPTGEAARQLGIRPRTLREWAQKGIVDPDLVTAGGRYRWDVERVRAVLQEMQRQRREEEDRR